MGWRQKSDLGLELVAQAHELLRIDEHWLVDKGNGFTWWAGEFAQTVWTDAGLYFNGQSTYRLHAETDLLRGRGKEHLYETAIEREMDQCSLSSVIYDIDDDTFKLHCSAFVTTDNVHWLQKAFLAGVALQVAEATTIGHNLATAIGGVPATSAHPTAGIRTDAHPDLDLVQRFFKPLGAQRSRWTDAVEWQRMERTMEREAQEFFCDHRSHLRATFAWTCTPSSTIILEVNSEEPHPVLGNGLHFTLTVPLKIAEEHVARLALELNLYERREWKRCHMLGSWSCHDGQLAYRSFVPNTVYNPELLPELALSMAVRAQWTDEFFQEKKRQAMQPAAPPAAVET